MPGVYASVSELVSSRFRRLTNLELWCGKPSSPPSSLLCPTAARQLLEPARQLSHLLLQGVSSAVDDQLLFRLWEGGANAMEALTNVFFDRCHEISVLTYARSIVQHNKLVETSFDFVNCIDD